MKRVLVLLAALGVAVPAGLVATVLLWPAWGWLERATGIESLGHSGPAGWCYLAVTALCLAVAAMLALRVRP